MSRVEIYTDGACRGNPGAGGWGAVLRYRGRERELYGGERDTTNNRMELTAAIRALEALQRRCRVSVYTDSKYVRDGITTWLADWKRRDWRTADRKPVKNQDLWQRSTSSRPGTTSNGTGCADTTATRRTSARMRSRTGASTSSKDRPRVRRLAAILSSRAPDRP